MEEKIYRQGVSRIVDDIEVQHLSGAGWSPYKQWNREHGDTKSTTEGTYHIKTMKDSKGYLYRRDRGRTRFIALHNRCGGSGGTFSSKCSGRVESEARLGDLE